MPNPAMKGIKLTATIVGINWLEWFWAFWLRSLSLEERSKACAQRLQSFQRRYNLTVWPDGHLGDLESGFAVIKFKVVFIEAGFNVLYSLTVEDKFGNRWQMPVISNSWKETVLPYASISILPLIFSEDGRILAVCRKQYRYGVGKRVWSFAQGYASDTSGTLMSMFLRELSDEFGSVDFIRIIGRFSENPDYVDREFLYAVAILQECFPKGIDLEQSKDVRLIDLSSPEALQNIRQEQTKLGEFSNTALHALWYLEPLLREANFNSKHLQNLILSLKQPPNC